MSEENETPKPKSGGGWVILVALVLLGGCSQLDLDSHSGDHCYENYKTYTSRGNPSGISESAYVARCHESDEAMRKVYGR